MLGYTGVRAPGSALFLVGLLSTIVCSMNGCSTFFSWNGRHHIDSQPLIEEHTHATFTTIAGRRYTLSVQVVFDPKGVDDREGMADVAGQDAPRREGEGWPGHHLHGGRRVASSRARPTSSTAGRSASPTGRLTVERLVGPFTSASVAPVSVDVDLGPDRVGRNVVSERRLVVYDDALPLFDRNAILGAVAGAIALTVGFLLLVVSWWRGRGGRRKRSGIPRSSVV